MELPVLRLRGGIGGDLEKFLCEICGKMLTSKRKLDLHMDSVHVSHPDFDCILTSNGLLKWKCSLCNNLLSSEQRIISHLVKTHGKTNLLGQGQKQNLDSRTTLWRRKRSADGTFVGQRSFFKSNSPIDSPYMSYSAAANKSIISDSPSKSVEEDIHVQTTGDVPDVEKELPVISEYSQVPEQAEPSIHNDCSYYGLDGPEFSLRKDTNETETTSSDDSDFEDDEDQLQTTCISDSVKEFTEKEKLSVLILSYIAKHKLNGSASVELLDLLKLIVPEDNKLHSLTLTQINEALGNCVTNIYDYCGKCFSIFPKDDNSYQCSTIDGEGQQCTGLRYRGNLRRQAKKQRNLYFVTVSLEQQLSKLLERDGIWTKIQQYKKLPSSSNIRDIVDGTEYKKFKQNGGFLTNEDHLTLLFNTDGIPLCNDIM